jgi:hypothetical protein
MLRRKNAKASGIVLYGIVLGLVLALPGCSNTGCSSAEARNGCWPAIGSKAEQELLRHAGPRGGGGSYGVGNSS